MEQRGVLVKLISASDLKKVNAFGKMSVYGVAWIDPTKKVSSPVDKKGNMNPTWNATLRLMVDSRLLEDGNAVLVVDLYSHSTFGYKHVGSCKIWLSDLKASVKATDAKDDKGTDKTPTTSAPSAESSSSGYNFMAVPVLRKSGKAKGTLNLFVKLGEVLKFPQPQVPAAYPHATPDFENRGAPAPATPVLAYPAFGYQVGHQPGAAQPYPKYQQAPYPGQMPPPYYPPGGYAAPPPPRRSGGGLGGGMGAGLLGGALGGLLLGSMLDGGGGGCGGGDGGGCGGGGCGS